ncbi:MAG: hypothetical protein IJ192_10705 [Clostridia bacterium]|nr:hypothetical protein [Clostridia bacterium]MBR2177166.1 hypothetical protein [Clostridia bacterium]
MGPSVMTVDATVANSFTITSDLVKPIVDAINSGLDVLIPVGIGIMSTFIGIQLIRRVIFTFL